jgi:hypothetical protein
MIKEVFLSCWKKMGITYAILIAESIIFAFFPFYLGRAIDGLIEKDWFWFNTYVIVCFIGFVLGSFRRVYDTRVFGKAWKDLSTDVSCKLIDNNFDPSKIITRSRMTGRFIDFFEFAIPRLLRGIFTISVSLCMIYNLIHMHVTYIVIAFVSTSFISLLVSYKQQHWDDKVTDADDMNNQAITDRDKELVKESYDNRIHCYIKTSDWEAADWLQSVFFSMLGEIFIIIRLSQGSVTPGEILTAVGYIWNLFGQTATVRFFLGWLRSVEIAQKRIEEGMQ